MTPVSRTFLVARVENEGTVFRRRSQNAFKPASSVSLIWLIDDAENECPINVFADLFDLRLETLCTYTSASAFSER